MLTKLEITEYTHPGELLNEYLEEFGFSQAALAKRSKLDPKLIEAVCACKSPVTQKIADALQAVFNRPARLWLQIQSQWDVSKEKRRQAFENAFKDVERITRWELRYRGLENKDWFRTMKMEEARKLKPGSRAWLRTIHNEAQQVEVVVAECTKKWPDNVRVVLKFLDDMEYPMWMYTQYDIQDNRLLLKEPLKGGEKHEARGKTSTRR